MLLGYPYRWLITILYYQLLFAGLRGHPADWVDMWVEADRPQGYVGWGGLSQAYTVASSVGAFDDIQGTVMTRNSGIRTPHVEYPKVGIFNARNHYSLEL